MGLSDDALLETIQKQSFNYFVEERNAATGLVRDRANNFQKGATASQASIAATGFALTAYPVAVERGWMDRDTAYEITRRTLQFFLTQAAQEHGFFYHFLDMQTGERARKSELSPIDTSLLLAGILFAAEYFEDSALRDLVTQIYERIDWNWMLHGGETLAMAWSPEEGFSKGRWDHYNESMIMYLLAIGSPTHPIPASSWQAIAKPVGSYKDFRVIQMPPLFTHQYSHVWVDFRDKNDGYADYFQNSVNATRANRAFAIDQSSKFMSYGPNSWGLTACDGPFGYRAYGAPPGWASHDGTLAPTACGGSIVFTPKESIDCLRNFYEHLGDRLWGDYGFSDSFNLDKNWFDKDVIGIDQGTLLLMIENYRTGLIWKVMNNNQVLQEAMKKVGFKPGTIKLPWPDPPEYKAAYRRGGMKIDGYLNDWSAEIPVLKLDKTFRENGDIKDDEDMKGEIRFAWDENALYLSVSVTDNEIVVTHSGKNIWQDDLLELYVDPQGDGLFWYQKEDFQIGFRPHAGDEDVSVWSWFQGGEPGGGESAVQSGDITAHGYVHEKGFVIEAAIKWNYLGIHPEPGATVRISPALHDIDRDRSGGKLHWFFRNEEEFQRFVLGKITLQKSPISNNNQAGVTP